MFSGKRSKIRYVLTGMFVVIVMIAFVGLKNGSDNTANVEEHLALGQKYLSEMEYEAALAEFNQVIVIEPYNEEANRALLAVAVEMQDYPAAIDAAGRMAAALSEFSEEELLSVQAAYSGVDRKDEIIGFYSMLYHLNPSDAVMENLLLAEAQDYNFTALENTLTDMKNKGIENDKYISHVLNYFIQKENEEAIDNFITACEENELSDTVLQNYTIYEMLMEDSSYDEILAYIEENESIDSLINNIAEEEIYYIGKYDSEGNAEGKGICYYGYGKFSDTRLYIGDFKDGVRNGSGIAYSDRANYIICEWQNDLPNGHAEKHMHEDYSIGALRDGHISEPTTMYDLLGDIVYICGIPDDRFESGYAYADGGDYSDLLDDPCPANHTYCWDCSEKMEEAL